MRAQQLEESIKQLELEILQLKKSKNNIKKYFQNIFKKTNILVGVLLSTLFSTFVLYAANVSIPNIFVDGTVASADDVNANFTALKTAIENIPDYGTFPDWILGDDTNDAAYMDGNIGIGTTAPVHKLDIGGDARLFDADNEPSLIFSKNHADVPGSSGYSAGIVAPEGITSRDLAFYSQYQGTYSERMRITGSGRVGIGTSDPNYSLDVAGDARFYDADSEPSLIFSKSHGDMQGVAGYNAAIKAPEVSTSRELAFFTQYQPNYAERMRIDGIGNVGIATTDPKTKLHVKDGDVYVETINNGIILRSPNSSCFRITVDDSGAFTSASITCP
jgi:hypothetical protein